MSFWRSARDGRRATAPRDWIAVSLVTWIAPIPLGLIMLGVPVMLMWLLESLSLATPSAVSLTFGLGWIVLFAPALSWLGLVLALPAIWLILRNGWGGWGSFAMGGLAIGWVAAGLLDGMHAVAPMAFGLFHGLIWRLAMGLLRPEVFALQKI